MNAPFLSLAVGTPVLRVLSGRLSGAEAFAAYLTMLDRWRKLPFRVPGLPRDVLAADWPAGEAVALFEELVDVLERPALDHARGCWTA